MIRIILVLLTLIVFLIGGLPILAVEWVIGKFYPQAAAISQLRIVQGVLKFILFLSGTKLTVIGEEHVPKDAPVLYVGNHKSYFDVVITYARCPRLTGYIAKDNILRVPLLPLWMRRLNCLFLNREDVREGLKIILAGIEQLKSGISMCIFPEGTRNATDAQMLPFKEGSFKLAEKSGCPIIPMAITNSAEIFENHFPWVRPTHVILEYGAPIDPGALEKETRKKLGAYCQDIIREMLDKNEALI